MRLIHKYLIISAGITAAFTNFIACGAQMYKASLHDDHVKGPEAALSEDPNSATFGLHAPKGWIKLPIAYRIDKNMSKTQQAALQGAMKTWEAATGKTLFSFTGTHSGTTGDTFPDLHSSLRDQINGQYFDEHWGKTGKSTSVLATTIWNNPGGNYQSIDAADIRYNSELYFISDALTQSPVDGREIVDMQSLATHELGHLLGLSHVPDTYDSSSIMNPSIMIGEGLASRSISTGDIKRIQKIYGCQGTACDVDATARAILQSGLQYSVTGNQPAPAH